MALVRLALKNEGLIVPGYTHLQRAQPILLQHLLLSYVEQVDVCLIYLFPSTLECPEELYCFDIFRRKACMLVFLIKQ